MGAAGGVRRTRTLRAVVVRASAASKRFTHSLGYGECKPAHFRHSLGYGESAYFSVAWASFSLEGFSLLRDFPSNPQEGAGLLRAARPHEAFLGHFWGIFEHF